MRESACEQGRPSAGETDADRVGRLDLHDDFFDGAGRDQMKLRDPIAPTDREFG